MQEGSGIVRARSNPGSFCIMEHIIDRINDYEVRNMIVWEGNKKEFGTEHQSPSVPQNAVKIRDSEGFIGKAVPFGIAPMIICMLIVFLKPYHFDHF